jgi:4-carboxymuconolactone decarboxylase
MARVSYATVSQASGDAREVLASMEQRGREALNIHRAVARSPNSLRNFFRLGNSLLQYGQLAPNLRELAILRIAQVTGADYEWAHHVPMAKTAGVKDSQIAHLADWENLDEFSPVEKAVLGYVQATTSCSVTDAVFDAARSFLSEAEMVELTLVCGYWSMVACLLLALRIDIEPSAKKYLPIP